tara:strand:- start:16322 stop:17023 length:702 start_codon:yes stop_codon:yes gene_type:complete
MSVPERLSVSERDSLLSEAERVVDWLAAVVYLPDRQLEETDAEYLSAGRLSSLGIKESHEQVRHLQAVFQALPLEHHANALLFYGGYPKEAMAALADGDVATTVELLTHINETLRPPVVVERRRVIAEGIPVALPRRVGRQAVDEVVARPPTDWGVSADGLEWQADALCAETDPEAFFPEKGGSTRAAKQICASCDVTAECLSYALQNDERFGIWGGYSERERRKLKRNTQGR